MARDPDRITQLERTRRGVCARCGSTSAEHANGTCPDGKGSYAWAHTGEEMRAMIARLESALAKYRRH